MASRILGKGDVLTLIEKAEQAIDEKKAMELEKKLRENTFTLSDYLDQLRQLKKMGSLESILSMMPGMNTGALKDAQIDEKALAHQEAIIRSMTLDERTHPEMLNASRKRRIALGSGTTVEEVNKLLRQFDQMRKMFKGMNKKGNRRKFSRGMMGGGFPGNFGF
jgi:signal recognition particle subunit SRP54